MDIKCVIIYLRGEKMNIQKNFDEDTLIDMMFDGLSVECFKSLWNVDKMFDVPIKLPSGFYRQNYFAVI